MNLRTKIPLLATVLCLLPGVAAPGSFQDGESVLDAGIDREDLGTATLSKTGPLSVFASVEEAWERADADALVELLDERDRVTISFIHGGGRGGSFNRDQAYFLLHDAFRFSRVERFEFRRYWNLGDDGRSPYAVAAREIVTDSGLVREDRVYISLRPGGGSWVVGEIRSVEP